MLRIALTMAAVGAMAAGCQRPPTAERANEPNTEMSDRTGQDANSQPGAEAGQTATIQGQIAKVEADKLEIETSGGEKVDLKMGANVMTPEGQPIQTSQLHEGAEVRASYSEMGGDKVVSTIEMLNEAAPGQGQPGASPAEPSQPGASPDHQGASPTQPGQGQ